MEKKVKINFDDLAYIGADGKDYATREAMEEADRKYLSQKKPDIPYIGKDGQDYYTKEDLDLADSEYTEATIEDMPKVR